MSVEIQLDKVRHLRFDTNSLIQAEKALGIGIGDICLALQKRPSLELTRGMLWAGLLPEDPTLTLETVGSWLKPKKIAVVWPKLLEALNPWFAEDDSPSPLADSPGENCGPSLVTTSG